MSELVLLERRIRRTALQDGLLAVVVLGIAILVFAVAVTTARNGVSGRTAMVALFGVAFLWVSWVMLQSVRALWPAKASAVYRELSGDGKGIAWSHLTTGAFSAIKVYFLDGTMCTLYSGKRDAETLLAFVMQRAPHAIIGFGAEQQAAYADLVTKGRAAKTSQ